LDCRSGSSPGAVIDRVGAKWVILTGTALVGASLLLMARMTKLWQYEALCALEVLGYVFAGPMQRRCCGAMVSRAARASDGIAYLGLGSGGVVAPMPCELFDTKLRLAARFGNCGSGTDGSFVPVWDWVTRSTPEESGLRPDAEPREVFRRCFRYNGIVWSGGSGFATKNFWLILFGSTLAIGAIGAVIQHFILFLKDQGYSSAVAARFSAGLLVASLAGRILVGYAWIL